MELHQLRTFVAVAEEGHLTRAAERLFVSQPAVSAHIKSLEGELGVTLFHRTPRGMTLTREGERLAGRARRILEDAQSLLGEAQGMSGALSGSFSLGLNTDSAFLRIGEIFARIRGNYPGISLSLANSSSRNIVRDVRRGTLDAGFAYGDVSGDGVQADPLTEVPFHVVGPVQWAERLDGADWAALADMPWIWMAENCPFLEVLDRRFATLGVEPRKCTEGDHEDILRALVIAGEGLTLMRSDEAAEAQERGLLAVWPGDPLNMTLSLVRRGARQDEPVLQAVRDVILAVWG